jgi:enamine deaminase RidA (YjgF/YER057c/UK114 family)
MKPDPTKIERWRGSAVGRSRMVAFGELVWAVSNACTPGADFEAQAVETLQRLDQALREAGSDRGRLLSVQVILVDISMRDAFDALWQAWLGPDPEHWPQRAVHGGALAPGLLLEVMATAARSVDGAV